MHYTKKDILELAERSQDGSYRTLLSLDHDDTAYSGGLSTKWDFEGPGFVEYIVHPSDWEVRASADTGRRYHRFERV